MIRVYVENWGGYGIIGLSQRVKLENGKGIKLSLRRNYGRHNEI